MPIGAGGPAVQFNRVLCGVPSPRSGRVRGRVGTPHRTLFVRTLGSWQLLVAGGCGGRRFCGAVRLRSPGEPIAEWGRSAWEVAHESIHAFAVYPVAVVGDGRI